jgi:hypothetical protein
VDPAPSASSAYVDFGCSSKYYNLWKTARSHPGLLLLKHFFLSASDGSSVSMYPYRKHMRLARDSNIDSAVIEIKAHAQNLKRSHQLAPKHKCRRGQYERYERNSVLLDGISPRVDFCCRNSSADYCTLCRKVNQSQATSLQCCI